MRATVLERRHAQRRCCCRTVRVARDSRPEWKGGSGMTVPACCPCCSARVDCVHVGLRYSQCTLQYEESPLDHDAVLLSRAVGALLKSCWERRSPPADPALHVAYRDGLAVVDQGGDREDALWRVEGEVTAYVLAFFEQLPGVARGEISRDSWLASRRLSMSVFWMQDLDAVFTAAATRIRALNKECSRA